MPKRNRTNRAGRGLLFSNRTALLFAILLLVSLALAFASIFHSEMWGDYNEKFLLKVANQQSLAQQIENASLSAIQGEEIAFENLRKVRDAYQDSLDKLKKGDSEEGLPPSPSEVSPLLRRAENAWFAQREGADKVIVAKDAIQAFRQRADETDAMLDELYIAVDEAASTMVENDSPPARVLTAARQLTRIQEMRSSLKDVLAGGPTSLHAIDRGTAVAEEFYILLNALLQGDTDLDLPPEDNDEVRSSLNNIKLYYDNMRESADQLVELVSGVLPAFEATGRMSDATVRLIESQDDLIEAYRQQPGRFKLGPVTVGPLTALIFGALALFLLFLLGLQQLTEARRRESESKALNEANQQAIQRLLDEMGDLADGDLTVEATVTADVTGAIADSINYAIDALRHLVTAINETSEKVTSSAQTTRSTAIGLAEASELQAQQIAQATGSIKSMTTAIDEMAQNAAESAEVASRSVEVASRGAQTVRDTIQGMDAIREQIQETSKRIKRLGESSQEIGEIVELIDDIADQTNILALNAAMQAAMAGEAGRGFAVVADEVQRLAERSSNATKQIEALVRTIQADTNEAVSSMEASTTGVVEGADLAEAAGGALHEIENVSNYIADLTRRIADSAQNESREAARINETVIGIQEVTNENAQGTRRTAESVETLAELAVELQRSVAGFRLP